MAERNVTEGIRRRIVEMLSVSIASRLDLSDVRHARIVARQCGVRFEVLEEATERNIEVSARQGLAVKRGDPKGRGKIQVLIPPPVMEVWVDWAESMAMTPVTALRSITHQYLLGSHEYVRDCRAWVVRGQLYSGAGVPQWSWVTRGAQLAIARRATVRNIRVSGILRELVTAASEGKIRGVEPIAVPQMYDGPDRYYYPPLLEELDKR